MGKIAIEFQNISKQYALGSIGAGTLSRDLNRLVGADSWEGGPVSQNRGRE